MQSVEKVESSEIVTEVKSSNVGSCNVTSPIKAMANAQVVPSGTSNFDNERCVDDGDVSEVESSNLDSEDLDDTHRFLLPAEDLGDHEGQGIDPETRSKLETLLEAAGLHSQSSSDSELLRRLTSSICSSVSALPRQLSESSDVLVEGVSAESLVSKPEDLLAVRQLLDGGRNSHETTDEGESLLSLACSAGYLELAQVLLAMRANVEDRGVKGDCTPLMEAASGGYVDIVRLLVEHAADVNAQSSAGNTPLHYAACGGHEDIIRVLLAAGANVEEHNENGHTPLMEAASAGHVGAAKILLDAGAGINTHSNEFKESALTLACYKGHLEMVKFLLDAGADQEHKTDEMHTALMEAAMDGHVDVARLLLEHGAQVNMPADSFESPLTLAACGGHVELANLLIERGANLEEVNDEGYTPLMEAAREGHEEMVALLLAHGAEINAQTEETQETALTLACCGGFLEVVDLLVKTLANVELGCSKPLMEASQEGHIEVVKYLIRAGASVNAQTQTGDTALTYACENGHTDVASLLLEAGAELEHKSEGGRTPLMKAARAGHMQTVQFLLSKGANPNHQTVNNDHTVLSLAAAGGHTAILELLLRAGANPLHKLKDDSTVIIEAAKGGHTAVVSLLLDWHPPGTDAASLIPASHLPNVKVAAVGGGASAADGAGQVLSPMRQTGVPPVPPSTPTGVHKALASEGGSVQSPTISSTTGQQQGGKPGAVKTASADSSTKMVRPPVMDDTRTAAIKNELLAKAAQNKKPQLLEELCRFEQSIANKTAKVAAKNQQGAPPPVLSDDDKARLQLKLRRQPPATEQQALASKAKVAVSQEAAKSAVDPAAANAGAAQPNPLLSAPWQIRAPPEGQWSSLGLGAGANRSQLLQQMMDEKSALRLMQVASGAVGRVGCEDIDLSTVMPKLDNEEQLQQQLTQLQLQQQFYPQPSGVLTSRLSPTVKMSPLDVDLDLKQYTQSALLSSLAKPNPVTAPPVAPPSTASNPPRTAAKAATVDSSKATADAIKPASSSSQTPSADLATQLVGILNSPNRPALQHDNKTNQLPKQQQPAAQQATNKVSRDLSNLGADLLDPSTQQQRLQQLLRQPHLSMEVIQQLLMKKDPQPELFHQLLQQPPIPQAQIQQAQKQLKAAVAAGAGAANAAGKKVKKTGPPPAALPHPPSTLPAAGAKGGEGACCTHHHHQHQHTASCGHDVTTCANTHCHHASQPPTPITAGAVTPGDPTAAPAFPPLYLTVDIDAQTESNHDTALTLACAGGHADLVRLLLQRNAQLEHRDKKGFTPLILAATAGHLEVVQILVDHSAEVEAQSERTKDTALSLACSGGRYEVVEYLLSCGANKEHRNISDYTPLSLAASGGYVNIIKLLLNAGAEINSRTGSKLGISPLMLAAMNGHTAAVKLLLDMGSDVNAMIETNRNTALTLACFQGRYEVVSLLVDRKANIEHRAKTGLTPLMEAASGGFVEVGRVLLDKGADVNAPPVPSSRDTALTIAADKGHHLFMELLIKRGAVLDVKNKKGDSPLWLACSGGHLDVVQALVNAGADVDSQDNRRVSCLMAAFRKGHLKVVKWLVRRIAQFPSDQECQRFIATVADAELKKKCQQCMEIILSAKARQAAEANKYATILLEELDAERSREETKKAAQARKREKKKAKKREKKTDKPDDDDDDDDDVKPEAESRVSDKPDVTENHRVDDSLSSRISAVPYTEAEYALLNEAAVPSGGSTPSVDQLAADGQSSQSDGAKSSARARRKGRTQRPKTRDSTARDELTTSTADDRLKSIATRPAVVDVPTPVHVAVVAASNKPVPAVDINKTAFKVVDAEVKVTTKNPASHSVETTNRSSGDFTESSRSKTSPGKADVKPASTDNKAPARLLTVSEKTAVNQSAASPVKSGAAPAKIANTPTPKKGSRKEEDWKEVVRPVASKAKMNLPANVAGRIIGRNGLHLHAIRYYTGAHLEVDKIRGSNDRLITIKGSQEAIKLAMDVLTALMTRPDKEVEQLLTKMKNKLASSTNPVDLAVLDLEGKTLGRPSQQAVAPVSATASASVISSSSSVAVSTLSYSAVISKAHQLQPQPSLASSGNNSNFSIGVWDNPTGAKSAGETTKSSSSCARQLFADSSASAAAPASSAKPAPTYASSMTAKTKVVTSLTSVPTAADASNLRLPLNQAGGTAVSLSLVSPMRLDQPPLPIKSSAVDSRPNSGFSAEYSPFRGGLVTDALVGKSDAAVDGRMNFASVAAAGVVVGGKNQSPPAPGVAMAMMHEDGNANSLEDLKAKAPGYKPRVSAADKAQSGKGKLPPPGMFYSQGPTNMMPSSLGAISISMPAADDGLPMELHHGPLTPGEYYDRPMTAPMQQDALSSHSNSSTPASSLSPRSSSDGGNKQRKDEYASPHQPMTLPKVESRLNPEAPDFTLPTSRHGQGIGGVPNFPPPFASFLMGGQGFAPPMPDVTSMPPPPDVTIFNQQVGAMGVGQLPPYGRLPNSFAQFNVPPQRPPPPIGRPLSREASPGLTVTDGVMPIGASSSFMDAQSQGSGGGFLGTQVPPPFMSQGQGQQGGERGQLQQQVPQMPRPIGTGRRNVGGVGQGPYGGPMERLSSHPAWGMSHGESELALLQQSSLMMGDLGAAGDLVLGGGGLFGQAVMSAAAYSVDPLADFASTDDQKLVQPFGHGQVGSSRHMFVNGGSSAAFMNPGLYGDRFDVPPTNQAWSSGKDLPNNDLRLGGWNWSSSSAI